LPSPLGVAEAREVGAALVGAHFTGTETLSRTVTLLTERFLPDLGCCSQDVCVQEEYRCRLATVQFVHPDDAPGFWDSYEALVQGDRDHMGIEKPYLPATAMTTSAAAMRSREAGAARRHRLAAEPGGQDRALRMCHLQRRQCRDDLIGCLVHPIHHLCVTGPLKPV
jgi:hypothetical protein